MMKAVKANSLGSVNTRKTLSDITNLQPQLKSPLKLKENLVTITENHTNKTYIDQLLKENAELLQEKQNLIVSRRVEMDKYRSSLDKFRLQNWNLAQAHTHMLAELNVAKDKVKTLQHELECKNALFKVKISELEEKARMQCQQNVLQVKEKETTPVEEAPKQPLQTEDKIENQLHEAPKQPLQTEDKIENKLHETAKRRPGRPPRSRSMEPMTQQAADGEMTENKRRCLRRQSLRPKPNREQTADIFEVDVGSSPGCQPTTEPPCTSSSVMEHNEEILQQSSNASERQRSSIGRPLRRAAGKIQSYKEPALHTKMRRPE